MVRNEGEFRIKLGRALSKLFVAAIVSYPITYLVFAILGDAAYFGSYMALAGHYPILNLWFFVLYVMLGFGLYAGINYLIGIHFVGLGQIVLNTSEEDEMADIEEETTTEEEKPQQQQSQKNSKEQAGTFKYSYQFYICLKSAMQTKNDVALRNVLTQSMEMVQATGEQFLIQQILNAPSGKLRAVVERLYQELSQIYQ